MIVIMMNINTSKLVTITQLNHCDTITIKKAIYPILLYFSNFPWKGHVYSAILSNSALPLVGISTRRIPVSV